jgi:hypothetical protein
MEGCVGSRAVLDAMVKRKIPSPRRESNPRTPIVQPVAQRYTMECTNIEDASLEAFTAVTFQVEFFCIVTLCSDVVGYQRFRGPFCRHVHGLLGCDAV